MNQSVYTLLCERDVPMAMVTVPNILRFLKTNQKFVVVDDGSLTEKSIDLLTALSEQISVITRSEREEFIVHTIRNYPHCLRFREEFPLALKLIDIPLLAHRESPRFTYTDSDIIYLHNCEPYFNRNENTHLRTDAVKISVKLRTALLKYKWSIPFKFNAGYFSYDAKDFDLDFISYFVSRSEVRNIPWLIEQTGWALLFGKTGKTYFPSEDQFICRENFDGPSPGIHAIHLIGGLKEKVEEWTYSGSILRESNHTSIFKESRNVTLMDWTRKSINRFLLK